MRICLLFILLAFSITGFSQTNLRGKVIDSASRPVAFASILLQKDNKTVKYATSDEKGEFTIAIAVPIENLTLKASHISHEPTTVALKKEDLNGVLILTLAEKKQDLREVIIQSKMGVAKVKGDTLSYNLKALTTGNEEKLRDVLKKLPGIEINEEGKITAQGKVINNLLVNGKKMFGDNHQIATENINASMLDGIDLLSNYETFGALKEIEGSNKTALNVKIKKEYLGKITGNIDLLGAYNKRYQAHSNLFKFNEKLNVSAIANLNNTGYQPLSSKDYFSLNKSVRQDLRNNDASVNSTLSLDDVPSFLLADENVTTKTNEFASFDITYLPNAKIQANGFSIFNQLRTKEDIRSTRLFLDTGQNVNIQENTNRSNRLFYNQSKFNIDYKPSNNTLWNYTILFDLSLSYADNAIANNLNGANNNITNNQDRWNLSLGHQLSFIRKIARNKLLSFNVFHEIKNRNTDLDINSNTSLFSRNNQYAQTNRIKKNDVGLYAKYTQKIKNHLFKASAGIVSESSTFTTANPIANNQRSIFDVQYLFTDASIQKSIGKFQYRAKVEARPYFLQNQTDNKTQFVVLPSLQAKYNFSQTHYVQASYSNVVDFPKIDRLNNFDYAEDFRTLTLTSPVLFNTLLRQDVITLNYFKLDLFSGVVLMANSSYIKYGNKLSTNTSKISNYNEVSPIVTNNQFSWNNSISYEQRVRKIKNKFKLNASYILSNFINQINSFDNKQKATLISIKASLASYFKSTAFNYDAGINYTLQRTKFTLFNQLNSVKRVSPFVSFNGIIAEKWSYYIDNTYENFSTQEVSTNFYNLGFRVKYKAKKFRYWVEGNNILNINNAQVIKVSTTNNILSTEIVNRLAGYIGLGIGFEL